MIGRGRGNFNDLAAQALDQRAVLRFGIDDNNVVVRGQRDLCDLALGGKGFARAGDTKNEAVAVEQFFPVCKDEIFGDRVLTVVDAVSVPNFLRLERHKHSEGFCRECPQRVDAPQTERQRGN